MVKFNFKLYKNQAHQSKNPCVKKVYQTPISNSFVCVCNSTYCDSIDSVDNQDKDLFYQEFITSRREHRLEKFKFKFDANFNQSIFLLKNNIYNN